MRRKQAAGGLRETAQHIVDDTVPVDGVGDGAPYAHIAQRAVLKVHAQILVGVVGSLLDVQARGSVGHA